MSSDFFICHASEDKEALVRPLAEALVKKGFTVWYDEFVLKPGDGIRTSIDKGIATCRNGLIVLSKNFFNKDWPQRELDALYALEVGARKDYSQSGMASITITFQASLHSWLINTQY